jgi:hypothetical protein
MTIRITRNAAGNCINFVGSSMPAYFNACLSGEVDSDIPTAVNVINDVQSEAQGETRYEFYQIPYTELSDKDGAQFADAQAAADYITAQGNVIGENGDVGRDLTGLAVDFRLDQTHTSIIMDNGAQWGVNTIKAVPAEDGTIHIKSIGQGIPTGSEEPTDNTLWEKLDHTLVSIDGIDAVGGLNDVVNALNELFTVGPFESIVISDPYSTLVADVDGTVTTGNIVGTNGIDPIGDDIFGSDSTGSLNGYKTTETIDQAGEYFTFDIRNEGQIGFGLIVSDSAYTAGDYAGGSNSSYIDPASFGTLNSAHYGFQWSHWFHPTPNGSWTQYGAKTGYVMGPAWYSSNTQFEARDEWLAGDPIKIRCGIDENGYIYVSSLKDDGTTWVMHARSNYPVPDGFEAHLGIKMGSTAPRLYTQPKVHLLEPAAPTMTFRYIESPDGVFHYPIFATTEEAEYYDQNHDGTTGSGTYHTHTYPDDATNTVWYMPDTGDTHSASSAPTVGTFMGNAINWTEITTLTDADLVPPAFSSTSVSVDEFASFNYQTQPQDVGYTTTITGSPSNPFLSFAGTLSGTAPEVTGDNVANPSDDYVLTITRTNSYGSSTGTLTVTVNNLTAPTTAITGFTHEATSTALVDSDTMDDGSVVSIDDIIDDGNRFIILKEWLDTYVLPAITAGSGDKSVFIGFADASPSWASVSAADFDLCYEFACDDTARAANNWRLKIHREGTELHNIGVGSTTSGLYDYMLNNISGTLQLGALVESRGYDMTSYYYDTSDSQWYWENELTGLSTSNRSIYIATAGCQLDLDDQYFSEATEPSPPTPTHTTSWDYAIDFDGSAERLQQVDSGSNRVPMKMSGTNNQVTGGSKTITSSDANARPWATCIVFNSTTYNSNQHVWNVGEGTGTTDDNIYLRRDANRNLWFGMGRTGDLVECYIGSIASNMNAWHAVYIGHSGARFGAGNTASQLENAFDFRYTNSANSWAVGTNQSTQANWTSGTVGGRMNRSYDGDFTIGGRGANRSFRGKIASFVSTTLRRNVAMPTDAEIFEMITDPMDWLTNYKVGNPFRLPWQGSDAGWNFSLNDGSSGYSTQVWLMGDGTNDSYSNMIRNQVVPSDQNYTKMNMISMVSNDIQNVTISGLS